MFWKMISESREGAFCVAGLSGPGGTEPNCKSEADGTDVVSLYTYVAEQSQVQREGNRKGLDIGVEGWGHRER